MQTHAAVEIPLTSHPCSTGTERYAVRGTGGSIITIMHVTKSLDDRVEKIQLFFFHVRASTEH